MSDLVTRGITGALFVGALLGSLWWHPIAASVVFSVFLILGLLEYYRFFDLNAGILPSKISGLFAGSTIFLLFAAAPFIPFKLPIFPIIFAVVFALFLTELWRKKSQPLMNNGVHAFGLLYLVIPFALLTYLSPVKHDFFPVVAGMLILIWTNDTFAYLTGRLLGRTKLMERISPKKTWEGTIGGLIFTIAAGSLIGWGTDHLVFWIIAAVVIAPSAIFGDLLESTFKRSLNIKDSGNILPGHGGILDRFDATLFGTPFFFLWYSIYILYF